ncbi:alcohol dehydrogenase-like 2 [Impatiens glandulifera]|uniref:alcohol dehydrogenase-like 2 n=1 Tax=Impatiens glandulifera TaxID=253017 RepID=UPI001FB0F1EC|nr:alcohol dehydrogenase-like 2 [Impatiens glandulifera]
MLFELKTLSFEIEFDRRNSQLQQSSTMEIIRCKAAICRKPGEALVIEEIEVDPPQAWEVRIKIICTSLCQTDITFWKLDTGPNPSFLPRILGHEAIGVVESVGENIMEVRKGDMVLPVFQSECGECKDCKSTKSNLCTGLLSQNYIGMPRGGDSRFRDTNGETIHNFLHVSSFTEYTVVDVANVVKINEDITPDKACLFGCGISTGLGAAMKVAEVEQGSSVAVFGLGAVGLAVAEGARLRGASKIIGVDLNPNKFEIGKKFGVTDFINPSTIKEKSISEVIQEMTDGGADYCFECIGLSSLMSEAFSSSRLGWGKTMIVGFDGHSPTLDLNLLDLLKGRTVSGSLMGGIKPKSDIPKLIQMYLNKELNLEGFISHEISFNDINKAFELLEQGKSIRCIIWMDKE